MKTQSSIGKPAADLSTLPEVELSRANTAFLASAMKTCGGSRLWQSRKIAEAREVLALSQFSRMKVIGLDLSVDLRAELLMNVTVPLMPKPGGPLVVAEHARLGVIYREECMAQPQPGSSFVQILSPRPVWHANVSPNPVQVLCLADRLPACTKLSEIILLAYGALTLMSIQIDVLDAAGVFNPFAARWFQEHAEMIPLSRKPFITPEVDKHEYCNPDS